MPLYIVVQRDDNPMAEPVLYQDSPANDSIVAEVSPAAQLALDYYDLSGLALTMARVLDPPQLQDWLDALALAYRHACREVINDTETRPGRTRAAFVHLD